MQSDRDLIERAFVLAYFIYPTPSIAKAIVERAFAELPAAMVVQDKRRSYSHTNVDKRRFESDTKGVQRAKVLLGRSHALQVLVMRFSDERPLVLKEAGPGDVTV